MAKRSCTSFNCPQDANIGIPIRQPEYKMVQDMSGHYWCQACKKRCELMSWGKEHDWPEVRVQSRTHYGFYSLLGEEDEWFSSIALGNEDMMDALYAGLIEIDE